tara:strand:+ start:163 stop:336 length:174 start_codon:yes stop_codon:yes gene_type:complete
MEMATNTLMRESLKTRLKLLRDESNLLSLKVKAIQKKKKEIAGEVKQIRELLSGRSK